MAYTLNGMGTAFYGQRDFQTNGTFITTEWIAIFYLPLIPIRSLRVKYQGQSKHKWYFFGYASDYTVYTKSRPNWKQVLSTYGYLCFMALWIYAVWKIGNANFNLLSTDFNVLLLLIVMALPLPMPHMLRRIAKKRLVTDSVRSK